MQGIAGPMREDINMLWQHDRAESSAATARQSDERAMQRTQEFNSAEALANRNFQERMSNTSWQRGTADMMAAGINPMLAFHQGGSSTPGGGQASGSGTKATPARGPQYRAGDVAMSQANAAQINAINAAARKSDAEADESKVRALNYPKTGRLTEAQEGETIARTPTYAWSIERTKQEIKESDQRIAHSIQDVQNLKAGEKLTEQQTRNLQETIAQIKATVQQLKAQTHYTYIHSAETASRDEETRQRIRSNLPEVERALKTLEAQRIQFDQPRQANDAAAQQSFMGAMGALGRAINPFTHIFK